MKYAVVSVGNTMAFIACGYYFADDLNRDELTWEKTEGSGTDLAKDQEQMTEHIAYYTFPFTLHGAFL